jgi:eukaryotic-like serine/threonine-protein kinase
MLRSSLRNGGEGCLSIASQAAEPSGTAEILAKSALDQVPTDWSPDGRYLVYTQTNTSGAGDLWVMQMQEPPPYPLAETRFDEQGARFSPDGRWLVYSSDESGKREVYIAAFAGLHTKRQLSYGGGQSPK